MYSKCCTCSAERFDFGLYKSNAAGQCGSKLQLCGVRGKKEAVVWCKRAPKEAVVWCKRAQKEAVVWCKRAQKEAVVWCKKAKKRQLCGVRGNQSIACSTTKRNFYLCCQSRVCHIRFEEELLHSSVHAYIRAAVYMHAYEKCFLVTSIQNGEHKLH